MSKISRREFLRGSLIAAAGVGIASSLHGKARGQVVGANDAVRVGVVGFHQQGGAHIKRFLQIPGVRVAALCDVDKEVIDREVKAFTERDEKVDTYTDVRKLLEDKNIDAISIATPNHWHALITIWACQAGKDVYVEKPVSHNIFEGRKMVEAARKYSRIVQAGTHFRSDKGLREVFEYIQKGNLGKILIARSFCYKERKSIGKVNGPQPIPASIDYNLWTGPAPLVPLMRKQLHYDWHWDWNTGNGDIGNQGIHEMDLCRMALGQKELAPQAISIGGRFGYDDDGKTPNTQIAILDYKPAPIIFEVRGLPQKDDAAMSNYRGIQIGIVIQCEHGYYAGGESGGWVYDNENKKIKQFLQRGAELHQANFIDVVRSRKLSDLHADILEGHISSSLCHMANISHRIGQLSSPEETKEAIKGSNAAMETFERFQEHLADNGVDLSMNKAVLGPWLKMDSAKEKFVSTGEYDTGRWANELLRRQYREPFVVPEKV